MKRKNIILCILVGLLSASCNESEFLKEVPEDFMSSDNSYITTADFDMAVNGLYYSIRKEFYGVDENTPFDYIYGTDLVFDGEPGTSNRHGNMVAAYNPTGNIPKAHWDYLYKLISDANVIIGRVAATDFTEEEKTQYVAKSRFFRGMAYRTLAYLYGGIPLVLEEISTPKTDFVRATKEETLRQALDDVKFAAENLPDITAVKDGEVSSPAAYHLLSELYLALGMNQEAVNAASEVINNPAFGLMKTRFGSRATETPGDVYWDLFRMNNQNRSAGNTEGVWVIQFETNLPGGGSSTADLKLDGNYMLERHCAPMTRDVKLRVTQPDGTVKDYSPFLWPIGDYTGGRGIGWGISTQYFSNTIWESDFDNDIRNANHNFVRKFAVNNPEFKAEFPDIDTIDVDNPPANLIVGQGSSMTIPGRYLYAYQTKCTTPYNHPSELYLNASIWELKSIAGTTYVDQYMFRLAETYLLRAEAYLNLNDKTKAAADINVVRERAHANPVDPADVDIDYILDERMRELGIEEKRRLTLMRMGKLYDRVMKCNPYYANPETNGDGIGMQEKYNLWPIPYSAIEANTDAVLEQNPGY